MDTIRTPDWVKHAVFYQIFPDRFARSGRVKHQEQIQIKPWRTPPEAQGYQGGDLYGIVDKLDDLKDLGVTALYLNPIFSSASNHRYHTFDYYTVDPILGGNAALRVLLDEAHARDMRVVLDGVFNHASRGFWPFHHILENGGDSPYIDWFNVHDWPLNPYAPDAETPHNYDAWMDLPALPEFNTDTPAVREFLFDVATHWIEFGADGWRLDVPNEIDDDSFWRDFRTAVKDVNPDAYIVGEIWHEASRWLQGDQFDAVMNYPFLAPTLSFFGADTLRSYEKAHLDFRPIDGETFAEEIERVFSLYDREVVQAQLNLLGSHDMGRPMWIVGDDVSAMRLAVLFQMTMPGAPCIYYGDEVGLSAGDDPHCREAYPWNTPGARNEGLRDVYRDAAALRHEYEVLRTGRVETLHADESIVVFRRFLDQSDAEADNENNAGAIDQPSEAVVLFNAATHRRTVQFKELAGTSWTRIWPQDDEGVVQIRGNDVNGGGRLYLDARSVQVLVA